VLDLTNWKLQLPTGQDGNVDEVKQPELATYRNDPWFLPTPDCTGVRFRAAVDGVTTSGSNYPRSELREMNGSDEAGWDTTSGTHTMAIDEAVTALPTGRPEIVVGQLHGASRYLVFVRLEGTDLYVSADGDSHYHLITDHYQLGTRFQVKFQVSGGQVNVYYDGTQEASVPEQDSGAYFKAGAYTQANCDNADPCSDGNYGEAVIYGLQVSHTDSAG
jgi:hypothetical protein